MLGLGDTSVFIAYVLSIACTLLCIVYGAVNWNRGDSPASDEDTRWAQDEDKLEDEL